MDEKIDIEFKSELPSPSSEINNESNIEQQQAESETRKSRKIKKNLGQQYMTKSGHLIKEKVCKQLEYCRKKCRERVKFDQQKDIFDAYWKLGNHKLRAAFLNSLIDVVPKKSVRIKGKDCINRNRSNSNAYFLEINGQRINVCQKCFLWTFDETEQIIKTISKKKCNSKSGVEKVDKVKDILAGGKISEEKINDHINSFPKYLESDLTIEKMHSLYLESNPQYPVSYTTYREIFTLTGIQIMPRPQTEDYCKKCKQSLIKTDSDVDEGENKSELKLSPKHQQDHEIEIKEEIQVKFEPFDQFDST